MSNFKEIKAWLISQKNNITKNNSVEFVEYLSKNYFKVDTGELNSIKIRNINELLNIFFRFLGPWKRKTFDFSKQIFIPDNIEEFDSNFIQRNTGLFSLLGFNWEKSHPIVTEIQTQLIKLGLFKERLIDYSEEDREAICKTIITRSPNSNFSSFYLNSSSHKEDNLRIFLSSTSFRNYFIFSNIEEIGNNFVRRNAGLFSLLGFTWEKNLPTITEIQTQLIKLGLFKKKLSDYGEEDREVICKTIITRSSESRFSSFYLNSSSHKEDNKKLFKLSQSFLRFLKEEPSRTIKKFLKKYDLSDIYLDENIKFSSLNSPWSEDQTNYLIRLYEENPDDLKKMIKETDLARETFGRSKEAVLAKLNILVNGRPDIKSSGTEISSRAISTFPKEVEEYLNEIANYAILHDISSPLLEFPCVAYYYPYDGSLTDDSVYVLLLPILFKGNDISKYKPFEIYIISRLYGKLINLNSDELISTNKILEARVHDNFFNRVKGEEVSIVGLQIRRKFSLNNNLETVEIPEKIEFESGTKIEFNYWIFK